MLRQYRYFYCICQTSIKNATTFQQVFNETIDQDPS